MSFRSTLLICLTVGAIFSPAATIAVVGIVTVAIVGVVTIGGLN